MTPEENAAYVERLTGFLRQPYEPRLCHVFPAICRACGGLFFAHGSDGHSPCAHSRYGLCVWCYQAWRVSMDECEQRDANDRVYVDAVRRGFRQTDVAAEKEN